MRDKILSKTKYIFFFFSFLISYLFLRKVSADETWSYGFSYNIASGLVPYQDFNMIVPPVFSFLFSIGLFFYKGILMFHIEQALLMVVICYLLEKLTKEKSVILISLLILLPIVNGLPTYNTLCCCIVLALIYAEKRKANDLEIGLLLGLILFTKQSIGFLILLCGCYFVKNDKERLKKRCLGVAIPTFFIFTYLLLAGNFNDFIDQCFLGMFEFSKNGESVAIWRPISIIVIWIAFLFYFRKQKYETEWIYAVAFYFICFPLFDLLHFLLGLFIILTAIIAHSDFLFNYHLEKFFLWLIILFPIGNMLVTLNAKGVYPNHIRNYEYRYLNPMEYHNAETLKEYNDNHLEEDIIILSSTSYIFKLSNHRRIEKLDLINRGNWGKDGTKKMIKAIQKKKSTLFLINKEELNYSTQTDKEVLKYIIKNGKRVDKVLYFDVYQLN